MKRVYSWLGLIEEWFSRT